MSDKRQDRNEATSHVFAQNQETVQLAHGSGGKLMHDLIERLFLRTFSNPALAAQEDQAVVEIGGVRLAFTTDAYVVDPIIFPGGTIGDLAVNGTINDLCMCGATPVCLSAAFILEEGCPFVALEPIVASMQAAASQVGVHIVTGDTKVVNRGKGDKIYITTAGIGIVEHSYAISVASIRPGDRIILSGTVADHGIAILAARGGFSFQSSVKSDTAALHTLVQAMLTAGGDGIHAMRDPTRGGVAATLNELATKANVGMGIDEYLIPLAPAVRGACELLGLDPLYVANEGKLIAVVAPECAERVLVAMQSHPFGRQAVIIGEVTADQPKIVSVRTAIGGRRILDMPIGELLPRIC
jgi:hydrogenase expression/formation protein HypE